MALFAKRVNASTVSSICTSVSSAPAMLPRRRILSMRSLRALAGDNCVSYLPDFDLFILGSVTGKCDSHFYIAKTGGRRAVPGAHGLHGLTFAAIWRAPQRPKLFATNCFAAVPKFGGDAAIAGILEHANFFAVFDFPSDFGRKLKLVAAIVDGPGAVGLHPDAVVGGRDQFFGRAAAGLDADVGHANDGKAIPAFGAHSDGRTIEADELRHFPIGKIAAELAVLDDVRALRGNAFVIVGEGAEAGAVFEAGIGDDVHDFGAVLQIIQFI